MNSLNSLILEGKIIEPTIIENEGEKVLRFFIETERFYVNKDNERVQETSRFICEGFGVFTEEKVYAKYDTGPRNPYCRKIEAV